MIEGFKLRLTSDELKLHCEGRAAHHQQRADQKESELPALIEAMDRLQSHKNQAAASVSNMTKSGYHMDHEDPVGSLKNDIRDHRNKVLVFSFFASHLFDEDYTLKEEDLRRLEILR